MRTHRRYILALLLAALTIGAVGTTATGAAGKDVLPINSLWIGKLDQHRDGQNALLDVVLWIQSRTDDKCTGVLWYPRVEDGKALTTALFKVEIQLREKDEITLAALDVLFGKGWEKGMAEGSVKKNKLTTQSKNGESVVEMNLTRVEYN